MKITNTKPKSYKVTITLDESEVEILSKTYDILFNIEAQFTQFENEVCKFPDITPDDLADVNYFLSTLIAADKISITVINSD